MPAVAYDNQASITGSAVTSLDTAAFTITSQPNRVAIVGLSQDQSVSAISYTVGGVADNGAIPGCFASNKFTASVTAPPSGSQTAHCQWTTATNAVFGVLTLYNVNQQTPTNNGTVSAALGTGTTLSVTITSGPGDRTVDHVFATAARMLSANTQTLGYNTAISTISGGSTYGPGTGTTTHQWTVSAGTGGRDDGVNVVQVADNPAITSIYVIP